MTALSDELLETVFDALSRRQETSLDHPDEWGNWDWSHATKDDDPRGPWLDKRIAGALNLPSIAPRWPNGKRFALCLTHDIDSVSHRHTPVAAVSESIRRLGGDGSLASRLFALARTGAKYTIQVARLRGRHDPIWHYEDWLRVESKHGFRSTFFAFPGRVAKPHAWDANYRMRDRVVFEGARMLAGDMLREIANRGWDVGVHGSYHSATDPRILGDERRQIEVAVGAEVHSVRQHYLHYDASTTPAAQVSAGLRVDSTQGFNSGIGFRAGTSLPYVGVGIGRRMRRFRS